MSGEERIVEWQYTFPVHGPGAQKVVAVGQPKVTAVMMSKIQIVPSERLLDPGWNTDERWVHITNNKPYMAAYFESVLDVIECPTWTLQG